ncbi:unnamed protein product [Fraxinus pennsylvanica]|uniref:C2H2-type domain-containing protein n=1 Tax=Fraxinus pennsylvanica TaxID=56036 RepID=A0AAD1Z899_9LAMI|nr:unnamed protein product [Fraxinus pennsylvanica]
MEKHKCKLCSRKFANGRALGGHMRSHVMYFCAEKKEENNGKVNRFENCHQQIDQGDDFQSSSAPSSSSSSDGEDEEREEKRILCYGLMREKKKGFCVIQGRESETDSSKNKLKRVRKLTTSGIKSKKSDYFEHLSEMVEPEPLSSISDTTPEENVAYCLMMLSRDKWKRKESDNEEEENSGVVYRNLIGLHDKRNKPNKVLKTKARGKYRCETCNKVFRSYQALGGHRASHKKIKVERPPPEVALKTRNKANAGGGSTVAEAVEVEEKKVHHECPVCYRIFSSGQALGGHKRSHFTRAAAISSSTTSIKPFSRFGETFNIDLNLPAQIDEDEEISAVSDSEFVNPIKQ